MASSRIQQTSNTEKATWSPGKARAESGKSWLGATQNGEALDPDGVLHSAAQWAATITGAHGAAIAVGDASEMRCCASIGSAPAVTATITTRSGLSGICLSTAQSVHCDDTETDSRVDADACRELDLRSLLIVPVLVESRLAALIEVFSSQPRAFDARHQENLARLADSLAVLLAERSTAGEGTAKAQISPAAPVPRSSAFKKAAPAVKSFPAAAATRARIASAAGQAFSINWREFSSAKKAGIAAVCLVLVIGLVWYLVGRDHTSAADRVNADVISQEKSAAAPPAPEVTVDQSALSLAAPGEGASSQTQLTPGKLVRRVEPIYPASARDSGIGGSVVLTATISQTGAMENVKVVRGPDALADAAADAVRQWVYEPYRRNGEAVAVQTTIVVKFAPPKRP